MRLTLRDVETRPPGAIRWTFEIASRRPEPTLVAAQSSYAGVLQDIQQLGLLDAAIELPQSTVEAISERILEELVRAKLSAISGAVA